MKHHIKKRQGLSKAILVLLVLFLAIVLRDAATGTLSVPLISLMGGVITGLALISLFVVKKD
jgi:hypothetical protein